MVPCSELGARSTIRKDHDSYRRQARANSRRAFDGLVQWSGLLDMYINVPRTDVDRMIKNYMVD